MIKLIINSGARDAEAILLFTMRVYVRGRAILLSGRWPTSAPLNHLDCGGGGGAPPAGAILLGQAASNKNEIDVRSNSTHSTPSWEGWTALLPHTCCSESTFTCLRFVFYCCEELVETGQGVTAISQSEICGLDMPLLINCSIQTKMTVILKQFHYWMRLTET